MKLTVRITQKAIDRLNAGEAVQVSNGELTILPPKKEKCVFCHRRQDETQMLKYTNGSKRIYVCEYCDGQARLTGEQEEE